MTRRLLVLSIALIASAFGACNCDEELYATPGRLTGVVCLVADGQAAANIPISITDSNGVKKETTTDAAGEFEEERLASGMATIVVQGPDGERSFDIEILPGREVRFDDEACHPPPPPPAPAGTITGCVCDDAVGAWVGAANVFVITDVGAIFTTGTDDVGCFSLPDVPIGLQVLKVQKGAFYEEHAVEVRAGEEVAITTPATCEPQIPPGELGSIEGRVCAPDGFTWLADATVYVENPDGSRSQDTTDTEGRYRLDNVPVGAQVVHVEKGSFSTTIDTVVNANTTTSIPEDQCQLEAPDVTVAVVTGDWDRVQDVLANIGVDSANITMYNGDNFQSGWVDELVMDYAVLSQYDIVFFNCGVADTDFASPLFANDAAIDNIRAFVAAGGSVYASDWAYSIVERSWPESVEFVGNDNMNSAAKKGEIANNIPGTIVDAQLAAAMAQNTIDLHYPLPSWVPMESVAQGGTVYIMGNAPLNDGTTLTDVPHTVGFNSGAGRVIYTSFHQEPGISLDQERVLELLMFEL